MAVLLACLVWGFAEATLFFVIPDVLLTLVALSNRRQALLGCVAALVGALLGGLVMYSWAATDRAAAVAAVDAVPFVPSALVARVGEDLARDGGEAIVRGPWTGRPYKVYAVQAPGTGLGALVFLAISVAARLPRFVFLALLAHGAGRFLVPRWGRRTTLAIWALAWALNYALYWSLMSR